MTSRLLAIATLAIVAACSNNDPRPTQPTPTDTVTFDLAGTRWALNWLDGETVTVREGGREAYIWLNPADGSVVGDASCNRLSSTYKADGGRVTFGELITTRMFCPDMPTETALMKALEATATWRITGSQLELQDAQGKSLARFEARNLY